MPKMTAAGASDVGRQRQVNEDRFHLDINRGVFIVVDGVGGQAAGGKAADTAIATLREQLERQSGPASDRIREAITAANNEIHRQAGLRPEWQGMACVLTAAVVEGDRVVVGHVGDTRLYTLRGQTIEKVTPDHSPVGEREDAQEISEVEAMRHPRRNEVYRDVGSDAHEPSDPEFIAVKTIEFPTDAALLLCSDGLTDLVASDTIRQIVQANAGDADAVVHALIDAANAAGGKDNVTVVYVEGAAFASAAPPRTRANGTFLLGLSVAFVLVLAALAVWQIGWPHTGPVARLWATPPGGAVVVRANESIMAAIERARPGFDVVVDPGEYRECIVLKDGVRVVSRVPRGAVIRLPGSAAESDPAVIATGVSGAELVGFRIVGDAATPLGIGVLARDADVRLVDIDVSGAATAAVDFGPGHVAELIGSDIHDNPGVALFVRSGAQSRVAHNVFTRNGTSDRARGAFVVENTAQPQWIRNVFQSVDPQGFVGMDESRRLALAKDNWFVVPPPAGGAAPATGRGRRGK